MRCKGGVVIPNADVHRRGGGCQPKDMCGHTGGGGQKKTADVNYEWPHSKIVGCRSSISRCGLVEQTEYPDAYYQTIRFSTSLVLRRPWWKSMTHQWRSNGANKKTSTEYPLPSAVPRGRLFTPREIVQGFIFLCAFITAIDTSGAFAFHIDAS